MTTKRDVLAAVAAGELSPEEGLRRLAALEAPTPARRTARASAVRLRVGAGTVDVVGDPAVHEVVVDGAHRLRRDPDGVLVVEGSDLAGGFSLLPRFGRRTQALTLRVAPDLPLDVGVDVGRLRVTRHEAAVRVRVATGSVDLIDLRGGVDAEVDMGTVAYTGTPRSGDYVLRSAVGKVVVALGAGSDVTVTARSDVGKVRMPSPSRGGAHAAVEVEGRSLVLGAGTARLTASSELGTVAVEVRS